jgi:hypothetical protein
MTETWFVALLPIGIIQAGALVWILATLKSQVKQALEDLKATRHHIAVLNDEAGELAQRMARVEERTSGIEKVAQRIEALLLRREK